MNLNEKTKLAEDSPERLETIYRLAKTMSRQNPEMAPITVELLTKNDEWCIGGADAFQLRVVSITDGGRARDETKLTIKDDYVHFIRHPAYSGIVQTIPATKHNLSLLASHNESKRWFIHEDEWREKVEKLAAEIVPMRNESKEMQDPEFMPHVDTKAIDEREKRSKELDEEIRQKQMMLQDYNKSILEKQATIQAPTPVEDDDEEDEKEPEFDDEPEDTEVDLEDKEPRPIGGILDAARENVLKKHADEIRDMKARGIKRIDLTKEFKGWMQEETQLVSA